ncbi:MAG: gluconate 2-dehydrogenase subunit 3 family protein [Ferruginibacter sp.]|uniref:gluconate 2-dehydrogenase subunit 3 family protein n=1 Tax=Ferruginibacter sp. TaxID=1940288 RepID=UPI0026595C06|nr:gluconate 2-dehydrogenase subunit 3 family protein [Ferruginibacter sp.]MDB5280807.1 gluconate 2-dehydrogenase subunit 3 family protein [Ferruginibacter sp.]
MERRSAIRNLAIITGGFIFLQSCKSTPCKASLNFKNITVNADQEMLLAEIASTIIPATTIPGAKEVGAHLFALKMLDDMYEKEVQQNFFTGLSQLENAAKKKFNKSFLDADAAQKEQVLLDIESKKEYDKEVFDFYAIMRQRTIEGYLNSKYVMTNVIKYEFIPSRQYNGFYPVMNL